MTHQTHPLPLRERVATLRADASNVPGEGSVLNSALLPLTRFARTRSRSALSREGRGKKGVTVLLTFVSETVT